MNHLCVTVCELASPVLWWICLTKRCLVSVCHPDYDIELLKKYSTIIIRVSCTIPVRSLWLDKKPIVWDERDSKLLKTFGRCQSSSNSNQAMSFLFWEMKSELPPPVLDTSYVILQYFDFISKLLRVYRWHALIYDKLWVSWC